MLFGLFAGEEPNFNPKSSQKKMTAKHNNVPYQTTSYLEARDLQEMENTDIKSFQNKIQGNIIFIWLFLGKL
jgi:hypothetical protein